MTTSNMHSSVGVKNPTSFFFNFPFFLTGLYSNLSFGIHAKLNARKDKLHVADKIKIKQGKKAKESKRDERQIHTVHMHKYRSREG